MSDAAVSNVESVEQDVIDALRPHQWQTAREVHTRIGRWSHISVRHTLRAMAEAAQVETRITGTLYQPVREYRAWK